MRHTNVLFEKDASFVMTFYFDSINFDFRSVCPNRCRFPYQNIRAIFSQFYTSISVLWKFLLVLLKIKMFHMRRHFVFAFCGQCLRESLNMFCVINILLKMLDNINLNANISKREPAFFCQHWGLEWCCWHFSSERSIDTDLQCVTWIKFWCVFPLIATSNWLTQHQRLMGGFEFTWLTYK